MRKAPERDRGLKVNQRHQTIPAPALARVYPVPRCNDESSLHSVRQCSHNSRVARSFVQISCSIALRPLRFLLFMICSVLMSDACCSSVVWPMCLEDSYQAARCLRGFLMEIRETCDCDAVFRRVQTQNSPSVFPSARRIRFVRIVGSIFSERNLTVPSPRTT